MGYLLKEGLKTLCGVNHWSYAVLWKIGSQNPRLLIWEDCYYEAASSSQLSGNLNPECAFHDRNGSWVSAEIRKLQSVEKVHLLVNRMMIDYQINIVGEGLVGRVAFTGNHQWVHAENYYREAHPSQVQKEVSQQFSAGMQTIVVIPVLPYGVVQFGSFMTILENIGFVNDVTSLLHQLGYLTEIPKQDFPSNEPQCSFDTFNYGESSMVGSQTTSFPLSQTGHYHCPELDFPSPHGMAKAEVIPSNSKMWTNPSIFSEQLNTPYSKNPTPNELKNPSFPKMGAHGSHSINHFTASKGEIEHDTLPLSSGDDLFDILGADFKNKLFSNFWQGSEPNPKMHNWDTHTNNNDNSESGIFSSANSDHLLEAVVSKVSPKQNLDISISNSSTPSSSFMYDQYGISNQMNGKFVAKAEGLSRESSGTCNSQRSSIFGSQISSWIRKDQKGKQNSSSVSTGYSKKPDDYGKANHKRLKPGENPKPRPKDRQLIQDRVKELREIVPNSGKCSIDTLLERTIKHMLFLQSVTKHADKLKQTGESKIISKDGGLVLKDNFEGGATWAYEVGSQSMVCPIIVEDLNQPRQMLVEMLCEERGLFLEIADIIRGLGLTILKGAMETRGDKIWARFSVEANRDVTRMEIFISLVRLLEQTVKNIGPQPEVEILTDQHEFHQVGSPISRLIYPSP